ncbi:MAG: polysaccharide biosynthesis/export family protein, partial [Terracidiphilus sp.]
MFRVKSTLGIFGFICLCCTPAGAQPPGPTLPPNQQASKSDAARVENANFNSPVLQRRTTRYRLYPSDQIAVTFPLTPEFNQTVVIEPDGYAGLTGAGDVRLAGLTTEEAVATIKAAYVKVLHDPIVDVELKNFNKPFFVVTGQVNHPGKFDLRGSTSATEAVAIAGGMNDAAKASDALLFRRVDGSRYEVTRINLKRIFSGKQQEDTDL